jgi:large-conductance mechanosensitive channel
MSTISAKRLTDIKKLSNRGSSMIQTVMNHTNNLSNDALLFKQDFANFILNKELIQLILAVYLGNVLQHFFNSFVTGIIMPLITLLIPQANKKNFENLELRFLGVNLQIGELLNNSINLLLGFIVSYVFVKYLLSNLLKI